jgi:hypothetical protein
MKINPFLPLAAAMAVIAGEPLTAAAAEAGDAASTGWYGSVGYSNTQRDGASINGLEARVGKVLTPNFATELELGGGVDSDTASKIGATVKERQNYTAALYGVGILPVTPQFHLLARLGVGENRFTQTDTGFRYRADQLSLNYGLGAVYQINEAYGVRADYTRKSYNHQGGDSDNWGLSLVRKF